MAPNRKGGKKGKKNGGKGFQLKKLIEKYAPKPKRPVSGYILFLMEYGKGKDFNGQELIIAGSKAWGKLSKAQKEKYNKRAAAEIGDYKQAMEEWQKKKQFLKKPPNSYGLFVRDFWKTEGQDYSQFGFGDMGKRCAQSWGKLSDTRKTEFKNLAGRCASYYGNCLRALDGGTDIAILISQAESHGFAEQLAGISNNENDPDEETDEEDPIYDEDSDSDEDDSVDDDGYYARTYGEDDEWPEEDEY